MAISDNEKLIVVKQFESLCKKSFANIVKNYYARQAVLYERNALYDELKHCYVRDNYFKRQYVFYVNDIPIIIESRKIAFMLMKLDEERRKIILLYYFAGFKDNAISILLNIPRATIQYRRSRALIELKDLFGGGTIV